MFRMARRPQYFLATVIVMAVIFLLQGFKSENPTVERRCRPTGGLVIDAGSSGTRAHIFKLSGPVVSEKFIAAEGHAFADDVSGAMGILFRNVSSLIPLKKRSCTPVIIGATAGLRKLGDTTANDILEEAMDILKKNGFEKVKATVLTGEQEGRFAWTTVNTLMGTITEGSQYGIIDVGGGSFQVAFRDSETNEIVSNSAMGFGVREAIKQLPECNDFTDCLAESLILLKTSGLKEKLPPFNPQSPINFFAFSYFYKLLGDSELPASHFLESTSADTCDQLNCIEQVAYLHAIIRYLQIPEDSTIRIAKKIDGRETAWPLGALIDTIKTTTNQANNLPS